ncbi:MAG: hypothetical protein QXZ06_08785, partial [Candidatus Jordarchaeales archaeon]
LPREDMIGIVGAKEVDDSNLVFYVHDILYLNGEDLTQKPYEERLELLENVIEWDKAEHFKKMPTFRVSNLKSFNESVKKCYYHPVSEGAMLKLASSRYYPDKRIPEWAKLKATKSIDLMVWNSKRSTPKKKPGMEINAWQYQVVFALTDEDLKAERWDPSVLVKWKGKNYAILGWTYSFGKKLERGDIIEVRTMRIRRYEDKNGVRYTFMFPMVVRVRNDKDEPDYFETVKRIEKAGVKPLSEESIIIRLKDCPYKDEDWCPLKELFRSKALSEKVKAYLETPRLPMPCRLANLYICAYLDPFEYYGFKEVKNDEHS